MAQAQLDEIMERIRASGGRVTQSRRMVVEEILGSGEHHLTAPDLIEALRRDDPEFHESTVYRVLERLAELGIVEPVQVQAGATVFHLADRTHRHHHLLCESCGAVVEAELDLLDPLAATVADRHGFVLRVASPVTLVGRCADCRTAD